MKRGRNGRRTQEPWLSALDAGPPALALVLNTRLVASLGPTGPSEVVLGHGKHCFPAACISLGGWGELSLTLAAARLLLHSMLHGDQPSSILLMSCKTPTPAPTGISSKSPVYFSNTGSGINACLS